MADLNLSVGLRMEKNSEIDSYLKKIDLALSNIGKNNGAGKIAQELFTSTEQAREFKSIMDTVFTGANRSFTMAGFKKALQENNNSVTQLKVKMTEYGQAGQIAFNKMAMGAMQAQRPTLQLSKALTDAFHTFGQTMKYAVSGSIYRTLVGGLSDAYRYVKQLDTSLNDIRIVTGKSSDEMAQFAVEAQKAAKALGSSTLDYTKGALIYYQQGIRDQGELNARTQTTAKVSNVTGLDTQTASSALTAVWNGYQIQAEKTEESVDKLAAVAANSAVNLEYLTTAMSKTAAVANTMGLPIDNLNAIIATTGAVTQQSAETVGTAYKTIIARLSDLKVEGMTEEDGIVTKLGTVSRDLAAGGINIKTENGELRDTLDIITEIGTKWQTWDKAQKDAIAIAVAGKRQYTQLFALFDNWDMYNKLVETSTQSQGELQRQQDIYMESTSAHLKQLSTELERTYSQFLNTEDLNELIGSVNGIVTAFNNFLSGFGGAKGVLTNFGAIFLTVFSNQIGQSLNNAITNVQILIQRLKDAKIASNVAKEGYIFDKSEVVNGQYYQAGNKGVKTVAGGANNVSAVITNKDGQAVGLSNQTLQKDLELRRQIVAVSGVLTEEQRKQLQDNVTEISVLEQQKQNLEEQAALYRADNQDKTGARDISTYIDKQKASIDALNEAQTVFNNSVTSGQINSEEFANALNTLADQENEAANELRIYKNEQEGIGQTLQPEVVSEFAKRIEDSTDALIVQKQAKIDNANAQTKVNNGEAQLIQYLKEEKKAANDAAVAQAKRAQAIGTAVRVIGATTQIINAVSSAMKVFGDETATAAEKAQALKTSVSSAVMGIGAIFGPIGMAIGGLAGAIINAIPIDGLEERLKTAKEKMAELSTAAQKTSEEINKYKQNTAKLDSIDRAEWKRLSEKAGKYGENVNKLSEEELAKYKSYVQTLVSLNGELVIGYNDQGDAIINNNTSLEKTVELYKQINREQIAAAGGFTSAADALGKQVETQRKQAKEDLDAYNRAQNEASAMLQGGLFSADQKLYLGKTQDEKNELKSLGIAIRDYGNKYAEALETIKGAQNKYADDQVVLEWFNSLEKKYEILEKAQNKLDAGFNINGRALMQGLMIDGAWDWDTKLKGVSAQKENEFAYNVAEMFGSYDDAEALQGYMEPLADAMLAATIGDLTKDENVQKLLIDGLAALMQQTGQSADEVAQYLEDTFSGFDFKVDSDGIIQWSREVVDTAVKALDRSASNIKNVGLVDKILGGENLDESENAQLDELIQKYVRLGYVQDEADGKRFVNLRRIQQLERDIAKQELENVIKTKKERLEALEEERKRLQLDLGDGVIDSSEYSTAMKVNTEEYEKVKKEIEDTELQIKAVVEVEKPDFGNFLTAMEEIEKPLQSWTEYQEKLINGDVVALSDIYSETMSAFGDDIEGAKIAWQEFQDELEKAKGITDTAKRTEALKNAFGKLASSYLSSKDALAGVTEENKELAISELELKNVENARAVVEGYLADKEEARKAVENYLAIAERDGAAAARAYAYDILTTAEASQAAKVAMYELLSAQTNFNDTSLSTSDKCRALADLANAARIAGAEIQSALAWSASAASIERDMERDRLAFTERGLTFNETEWLNNRKRQVNDLVQKSVEESQLELPPLNLGGSDGSGNGGGSGSGGAAKEAEKYNKVSKALENAKKHVEEYDKALGNAHSHEERMKALDMQKGALEEQKQALADAKEMYEDLLDEYRSNPALPEELKAYIDGSKEIPATMYDALDETTKKIVDEYQNVVSEYEGVVDEQIENEEDFRQNWLDCINEIKNEYEKMLDELEGQSSELSDAMDLDEVLGNFVDSDRYFDLIDNAQEQIDVLNDEIADLYSQLDDAPDDDAWLELSGTIQDLESKVRSLTKSVAEYVEKIKETPNTIFSNIQGLISNNISDINNAMSEASARGLKASADQYLALISANEEAKERYAQQLDYLDKMIGSYEEGSDKWLEAADQIQSAQDGYSKSLAAVYTNQKSILELYSSFYKDTIKNNTNAIDKKIKAVDDRIEKIKRNLEPIQDRIDDIEKIIDRIERDNDKIQKQQEAHQKKIDAANKKISDQELVIQAVIDAYQDEIQKNEDLRDSINDRYQDEIDNIQVIIDAKQDELDAIQEKNEALDKELAIEQALFDLESARNQRTVRIITHGRVDFAQDENAVREAQRAYDEAVYNKKIYDKQQEIKELEDQIEDLEERRDEELKFYDDEIERLQKMADLWGDITDKVEKIRRAEQVAELKSPDYVANILARDRTSEIEAQKTLDRILQQNSNIDAEQAKIDELQKKVDKNNRAIEVYQEKMLPLKDEVERVNTSLERFYERQLKRPLEDEKKAISDASETVTEKIEDLIKRWGQGLIKFEDAQKQIQGLIGKEVLDALNKEAGYTNSLTSYADKQYEITKKLNDQLNKSIETAIRVIENKPVAAVHVHSGGGGGDDSGGPKSSGWQDVTHGPGVEKIVATDSGYQIINIETGKPREYDLGLDKGYVGGGALDDKLRSLREFASGAAASNYGKATPIIAHEGELVLTPAQQEAMLANINAMQFGMTRMGSMLAGAGSSSSGSIINISMGNITLPQVHDGNDFVDFIVNNFQAAVNQRINRN